MGALGGWPDDAVAVAVAAASGDEVTGALAAALRIAVSDGAGVGAERATRQWQRHRSAWLYHHQQQQQQQRQQRRRGGCGGGSSHGAGSDADDAFDAPCGGTDDVKQQCAALSRTAVVLLHWLRTMRLLLAGHDQLFVRTKRASASARTLATPSTGTREAGNDPALELELEGVGAAVAKRERALRVARRADLLAMRHRMQSVN